MRVSSRYATAAAATIAVLTVLRFLYALPLEAVPDEADKHVWSQRLDFGYFDQPPLLMWVLAAVRRVVGSATLAIRLVPALLSAAASYYTFRLGRDTAGDHAAFRAVVLMNVAPQYFFGSMLATPDAPMVMFLSGASYYAWVGIARERPRAWILAGLFAGLALLSKYTAVLLFASAALFLLHSEHRRSLARREPWLALAVAMLIFSPQLIWNHAHDWVAFGFQWQHGFGSGGFSLRPRSTEYVLSQAAAIGPLLFAAVVAALVIVRRTWTRQPAGLRYLWCLAVVPLAFFLCSSLFRKVEANWPCFAYLPGILLVAAVYENGLREARRWRLLWRLTWASSAVVLGVILLHIYVPFLSLSKDRSDEFFGWASLGASAAGLSKEHPELIPAANRY